MMNIGPRPDRFPGREPEFQDIRPEPQAAEPGLASARFRGTAPRTILVIESLEKAFKDLGEVGEELEKFNKKVDKTLKGPSCTEKFWAQFAHGTSAGKVVWENLFNKYTKLSQKVDEFRPYIESLENLNSLRERSRLAHASSQQTFTILQNPQVSPEVKDQAAELHEETYQTIQILEKAPDEVLRSFREVDNLNRKIRKKFENYADQHKFLVPSDENFLVKGAGFIGNAIGATLKAGVFGITGISKLALKAIYNYPKTATLTVALAGAGAAYYTAPEATTTLVQSLPDRIGQAATKHLSPVAKAAYSTVVNVGSAAAKAIYSPVVNSGSAVAEAIYSPVVNAGSAVAEGISSAVNGAITTYSSEAKAFLADLSNAKDAALADLQGTVAAVGSLGIAGKVAASGKQLLTFVRDQGLRQAVSNNIGKTAVILTPVAFVGGWLFDDGIDGSTAALTTAGAGIAYEIARYATSKILQRNAQ